MRVGALEGRRVLVTGASAGIGRSVAQLVAEQGARVACLGRREDALHEVASSVSGVAVVADIRSPDAVEAAVAASERHLGGLDALVNCAGVYRPGGIQATSVEDWRLMFESNVIGLLLVTQAAVPRLRSSGHADIVNISSMGGRRVARVESGVYSGTKFAVHAISESMRRELFEFGIRVAVIAPGAVQTTFGSDTNDPEQLERIMRRRAETGLEPEDVARQVVRVLAEPPGVTVHEIAMTSTRQPPG